MKKISNILLAVTFALPLFTACETDNDSNPILNEPDTFTLNTPAYAANNVYDLKNAQTVELTCSQPDYGFPAATTYTVQASFEQDFIEATDVPFIAPPFQSQRYLLVVNIPKRTKSERRRPSR